MEKLKEIEQAVAGLSPDELAIFRDWFEEYDAQQWDRQIEMDIKAGKLDHLAEQALVDFAAGNYAEI